ncbi:DUF4397 domain-containing protein [Desulforamulus aquiferis]|uniref:DUF4397 domain-containing protein n=1 Tax=Desulforamulus aquiferis TaxID=1397668 RepID=A0AAW7ZFV1_9FIRM|nr:DUF4397 domain-containing protein [Desulforamulus aquiferis]MDO7788152.1 DUF4397 domain-containing protein [Desulforamulus aquiferis]
MSSYIRVLHASPDAPAVDVYANNTALARNLSYRNFTEYLQVPAGTYNLRVFPAGTMTNPVIDTTIEIPDRSIFTVAAKGRLADIGLLLVPDTPGTVPQGMINIRFVHLSPNAPNVDITLPDGTILFSNVPYQGITEYSTISPGTYTLQAREAGTNNIILNVPNQTFAPNRFYTAYAVGLVGETPPLQLLTPLDGNSYIRV